MLVKTLIIVGIYLVILIALLQVGFTVVEKTKRELSLFTAEFTNWKNCGDAALFREVGGSAVYSSNETSRGCSGG